MIWKDADLEWQVLVDGVGDTDIFQLLLPFLSYQYQLLSADLYFDCKQLNQGKLLLQRLFQFYKSYLDEFILR